MTESLSIWTVFDHPTDYPSDFVARRSVVDKSGINVTNELLRYQDVDALRDKLAARGLTRLSRGPDDAPNIMETWL
jgi:hypothetical protein